MVGAVVSLVDATVNVADQAAGSGLPAASFALVPTVTVMAVPAVGVRMLQRYMRGLIHCDEAVQVFDGVKLMAAAVDAGSMSREKLRATWVVSGTPVLPGAGDIPITRGRTTTSGMVKESCVSET
jgi:hypothetical protein